MPRGPLPSGRGPYIYNYQNVVSVHYVLLFRVHSCTRIIFRNKREPWVIYPLVSLEEYLILAFEQYLFVIIIRFHNMYGVCIQFIYGIHFRNVIVLNLFYCDGILSWFRGFYTGRGFLSPLFLTMQSFSMSNWIHRGCTPPPSGRVGIHSFPCIKISWNWKSSEMPCFLRNGIPRIQSCLSRFVISKSFLVVVKPNSTTATVVKLIFDLLPKQPSCKVAGFSSLRMGTFDTLAKSGLRASVVLPESNRV